MSHRTARLLVPLLALTSCHAGTDDATSPPRATIDTPSVPLAKQSPWPKFRADAEQTGRSDVRPSMLAKNGARKPWAFATGKGIFSSPVIAADGTIYLGSADRTF